MFGLWEAQGPVITGKVTELRLPEPRNFTSWQALRKDSQAELQPYEPKWTVFELSKSAFIARTRHAKALAKAGEAFQFFIFENAQNQLVGGITLGNIRRGAAQSGQIGYWLGTPHTGRGYMRDAVKALLTYSFSTLRLHRIEAACIQDNKRSIALLHDCGFHYEGSARAYLEINGKRQDHHLYACLPSDVSDFGS